MPQQPDHITIIYTRWYESPSSTNTDMFIIQWEEMLYNGKGVQMGGSKRDRGGEGEEEAVRKMYSIKWTALSTVQVTEMKKTSKQASNQLTIVDASLIESW